VQKQRASLGLLHHHKMHGKHREKTCPSHRGGSAQPAHQCTTTPQVPFGYFGGGGRSGDAGYVGGEDREQCESCARRLTFNFRKTFSK
jgi:hypothetical protein